MSKVVAFDLGSNTFRAILFDCKRGEIIASFEKTVRLAQGLSTSNKITDAAIDRVIKAIQQLPVAFRGYPIQAVTTQAMRAAHNSKEVLQRIKKHTAVEFEIINGDKEARLTLSAVRNRLKHLGIVAQEFVVVDIGGGSTEVMFFTKQHIATRSFPIGIVTATEKGLPSLENEFVEVKKFCDNRSYTDFVSTAGTPTTLAAIKRGLTYETYDARLINGMVINKSDLQSSLQQLLFLPKVEAQKLVGVNRDDLIITGIQIYEKFFEILGVESSIVVDDGLREGVALSRCEKETAS
ncbi:MAG: phosphatase [Campylobacterota bacterium]